MPGRKAVQTEEKRDRRIPTTRYEPDYRTGLTAQQVQEHYLHGWVNRAVEPPSKTTKEIIHENVFTYFNLVFTVLAVLLCLVGSFRNLTFMPVIIIGGVLSGILTPTEASVIAAAYALLLAVFVYKEMTFKDFLDATSESVITSAIILFIISSATPFGWVDGILRQKM